MSKRLQNQMIRKAAGLLFTVSTSPVDYPHVPRYYLREIEQEHEKCRSASILLKEGADRISKLEQEVERLRKENGDWEHKQIALRHDLEQLEAENKMLHRSLTAKPDIATSSGAAQAAMEYEIDLRERRITELESSENPATDHRRK